jgi:hypothetical protein
MSVSCALRRNNAARIVTAAVAGRSVLPAVMEAARRSRSFLPGGAFPSSI